MNVEFGMLKVGKMEILKDGNIERLRY